MSQAPSFNSPQAFADAFGVSRETLDRLTTYERLLKHWQKGTNLVSPATLDEIWHRHFADSAQLLALAGDWRSWVDLGSGAGFPGLVVAICAPNREDRRVHLVESNARKCAFVREVVRETECSVEIHDSRIESLGRSATVTGVDIVSARALAPLNRLFGLVAPYFGAATRGLFPKGRQAERELAQCAPAWDFDARLHPSLTDAQAAIVVVNALKKKGEGVKEAADE